ncbi:hypothetical protein BAOM_2946 [Peribacillus asahii]|uniref:Flavodoxin-like domain-containing protein n=1 Tax=Peribacillus asahii TaxID=228899 RepID=A0A3Q9RNG0_9BACI|nr:flavodoxin family protein [Peribacillus asahii]AZV43555.1 hypothetical protein BAOM_2946 [Peribacillus asahii]
MIKSLIVYYSLGGNTEVVANKIEEKLTSLGKEFDVLSLGKKSKFESVDIENYDIVFIGSPTYKEGKTPLYVLDYLRYILNTIILNYLNSLYLEQGIRNGHTLQEQLMKYLITLVKKQR